MFFKLVDRELRTTIHLIRRAAVGLFDKSRPSFPDLIQPLPWALFELSVSLPTPLLYRVSLPTPFLYRVSLPTPFLYRVSLRHCSYIECLYRHCSYIECLYRHRFKSSVSTDTSFISSVSTETALISSVSTDTALISSVSTDTPTGVFGFSTETASVRRSPSIVFSDVSFTTAIKTAINSFRIGNGEPVLD